MGAFKFEARTKSGKIVVGEIEAASRPEANRKIRDKKLVPLKVLPVGQRRKRLIGGGVSLKELQIFTRQFSTCIGSGMPIIESLQAMREGKGRNLSIALANVSQDIGRGKKLHEAMAQHPKIFDKMYTSLVSVGEESGTLAPALKRLADYIERSLYLRRKVMGALWYPAAVIVVAAIVVTVIMVWVVPTFQDLFETSGVELPAPTQMVISISEYFQTQYMQLIGWIIAIPIAFKIFYNSDTGRKIVDGVILKLPLFGELITYSATARFTRTLATLFDSGVPILEALAIAEQVVGNYHITKDVSKIAPFVQKGKKLSDPLANSKYMPPMAVQMISIGEQTGDLGAMLNRTGAFFEEEVEIKSNAMLSLIEPMLMVFLGGIVGGLVVSLYLPIFKISAVV